VLVVSALNDGVTGSGADQRHVVVDEQVLRPGLGQVRAAGTVDGHVRRVRVSGQGVA